jgi:FlaA1/EpsC-like NDP-sugar epimerase
MNVIDAALDCKVRRVVALSTDKACNPVNLYGATKLCSDKLFVAGNAYSGFQKTCFSVVRYGNVMGSRGSIIPFFVALRRDRAKEVPITDPRMTRFMITLEQGVELVWHALNNASGGEIFVKKIPSMKVTDIAKTILPSAKVKIIGIRPGEKIHEEMISCEDARYTLEYKDHFKIVPQILPHLHKSIAGTGRNRGSACKENFNYNSGTNSKWMKPNSLINWLKKEFPSEI